MRQLSLMAAVPPLVAAATTFALTPVAAAVARRIGAVDHPDERKVHDRPTARFGGMAVISGALAGLFTAALVGTHGPPLADPAWSWTGLFLGVLPVLWIAIRDDVHPVRPWVKLLFQVGGASLAAGFGISLPETVHLFGFPVTLGWAAAPLSVAWIVGITNAFNLIDGLDGLCAGLTVISAGAMGLVFLMTGQPALAMVAGVLAGAIAGFLPHNTHPASVFLGDTGAMSSGFFLACLALAGGATLSSGFAALLPVIILGLPIAEIVVSFFRRLLVRASGGSLPGVMVADRLHFHHRLLDMGFEHPRAVWVLYAVGGVLSFVSLLSILLTARQAGLLLLLLLVAGAVGVKRLGYGSGTHSRDERRGIRRALFVGFADAIVALAALALTVGLTDGWNGREFRDDMGAEEVISYGLATILAFWGVGLYRGTWWLKSGERLLRLLIGVAAAPFLVFLLMLVAQEPRIDATLLTSWTAVHLLTAFLARSGHRIGVVGLGSRRPEPSVQGAPTEVERAVENTTPPRRERTQQTQVALAVRVLKQVRSLEERPGTQRKA